MEIQDINTYIYLFQHPSNLILSVSNFFSFEKEVIINFVLTKANTDAAMGM